jgi:hypothetical protein
MHTVGDMGKPLSRKILRIELATVYTPGRVIAQSSSKALQTQFTKHAIDLYLKPKLACMQFRKAWS